MNQNGKLFTLRKLGTGDVIKFKDEHFTDTRQVPTSAYRKLCFTSFDIFADLHKCVVGSNEVVSNVYAQVLHSSKMYREGLKVYISELDNDDTVDIAKAALAVWHLTEILVLETRHFVDRKLTSWIQEHYCLQKINEMENYILDLDGSGDNNDDAYWRIVYGLLVCGQRELVKKLFSMNKKYASSLYLDTYEEIMVLLNGMPVADDEERFMEFGSWRDACYQALHTNVQIRGDERLKTMVMILCGDADVLLKYTDYWYEYMAAILLFSPPNSISDRFEVLMAKCLQAHNTDITPFDCIIVALMEFDVSSAVCDSSIFGLPWFNAHLTDLVTLAGHVSNDKLPDIHCSLREYYVMEFVIDVHGMDGMWQLMPEYLSTCKAYGLRLLENLLEREQPSSDIKAQKLIAICNRFHFVQLVNSIQLVRAMEWKQQKCFGACIYWLLQAKDVQRATALCNQLMDECVETGNREGLHAVVESLGESQTIVSSASTTFLRLYRDLLLVLEDCAYYQTNLSTIPKHELSEAKQDYRRVQVLAAKWIVNLFDSSVPAKFWKSLFEKLLPLLNVQPSLFRCNQLYKLVQRIQSIEISYQRDHLFANVPQTLLEHVNRALCESLAISIRTEATSSVVTSSPTKVTLSSMSKLSIITP